MYVTQRKVDKKKKKRKSKLSPGFDADIDENVYKIFTIFLNSISLLEKKVLTLRHNFINMYLKERNHKQTKKK